MWAESHIQMLALTQDSLRIVIFNAYPENLRSGVIGIIEIDAEAARHLSNHLLYGYGICGCRLILLNIVNPGRRTCSQLNEHFKALSK